MANVIGKLQLEVFVLSLLEPVSVGADARGLRGAPAQRARDRGRGGEGAGVERACSRNYRRRACTSSSMRTKTNRLEELFIRLVDKQERQFGMNELAVKRARGARPEPLAHQSRRFLDDRAQGVAARRANLDSDDRAARDHDDAVLHHLRQPRRQPHRHDGRRALHDVHRAGPHHDGRHHELVRERRVVVLLEQADAASRGDARRAAWRTRRSCSASSSAASCAACSWRRSSSSWRCSSRICTSRIRSSRSRRSC